MQGCRNCLGTGKSTESATYSHKPQSASKHNPPVLDCKFCGKKHVLRKTDNLACGKTFSRCGGKNHFAINCPKTRKKVHNVDLTDMDGDEEYLFIAKTNKYEKKGQITAKLSVNGSHVRFVIDTSADINTICRRFVKPADIQPTSCKLVMWNGARVAPLGEVTLPVFNVLTKETHEVKFIVVPNDLRCLLGLKAVLEMQLITINDTRFTSQVESVPETNKSFWDLGEAHLHVNADIKPCALRCRKIPIALGDPVKHDTYRLVDLGVIVPVTQMTVVTKSNDSLRLSIDPQPLNEALMREHYKLSTADDVLPMLRHAKVFSKLDVKNAFWHVCLDEESSPLTTMITPFGRFRWSRLPFGLKVSSELFQRRLNEALIGLDGTFTIADDITIAECGESQAEAIKDNDAKLEKLYERCREQNIVLNQEKKLLDKQR